jgi:hypothetical protein
MATRKRTTMYSSGGKKLYAVRNADGTFNDIQQYSRAHRADLARKSKAEAGTADAMASMTTAPAKKAPGK